MDMQSMKFKPFLARVDQFYFRQTRFARDQFFRTTKSTWGLSAEEWAAPQWQACRESY
jgi:hypothetical protein